MIRIPYYICDNEFIRIRENLKFGIRPAEKADNMLFQTAVKCIKADIIFARKLFTSCAFCTLMRPFCPGETWTKGVHLLYRYIA
jgi:hypothetical protein